MPPNELAQAIAWLQDCGRLQEIIADAFPKPDRWQMCARADEIHADESGVPLPAGYEVVGPWEPFAVGETWTSWKRPLRKLPAKDGGK